MRELKKCSKYFKKLHNIRLMPSPDQSWMNYPLNSGNNRVIKVCKNYIGDDDNAVIDRINIALINIGNKPHRSSFDETLDKFLTDCYLKHFLVSFLNATSCDIVNEKGYQMFATLGTLAANYLTGTRLACKNVGYAKQRVNN